MSEAKKRYYAFNKEDDQHHEGLCDHSYEYITELEKMLTESRNVFQNIWNNTDFCTCPAEGDCVCGQDGLLKIMKKIDEVIR